MILSGIQKIKRASATTVTNRAFLDKQNLAGWLAMTAGLISARGSGRGCAELELAGRCSIFCSPSDAMVHRYGCWPRSTLQKPNSHCALINSLQRKCPNPRRPFLGGNKSKASAETQDEPARTPTARAVDSFGACQIPTYVVTSRKTGVEFKNLPELRDGKRRHLHSFISHAEMIEQDRIIRSLIKSVDQ